jgi:hypothetical protein
MIANKTFQRLLLLLFIGCSNFIMAQDVAELSRRNGFKDIKLGTPIDSVKGTEFKKDIKEKNEFAAKLYEVSHPDYKNIGEVTIKKIQLKTYKDLVYEIVVITNKDTRLMKGMVKSFGEPKYILTTDTYNWLADSLSLTFKNHSKSEIKLTYRSFPLLKRMLADKGKKVDDIAQDF